MSSPGHSSSEVHPSAGEDGDNYMVADCSGCGEKGEYWLRVYRDQNYYRLHLTKTEGGPTAGKFCGNYSENARLGYFSRVGFFPFNYCAMQVGSTSS